MYTKEVVDYIEKAQKEGKNIETIRAELKTGGWNKADIDEAYKFLGGDTSAVSSEADPQAAVVPDNEVQSQSGLSTSPATQNYSMSADVEKSSRKGVLLKAVVVLGMLVVLGAGSVFANKYIFSKPNPQVLLLEAYENALATKSFKFDGVFKITADANTKQGVINFDGGVGFDGLVNYEDIDSPELDINFSLDGKGSLANTLSVDNLNLSGSTRYVGRNVFLKIDKVPEILSSFSNDVSSYLGNWYMIPESELFAGEVDQEDLGDTLKMIIDLNHDIKTEYIYTIIIKEFKDGIEKNGVDTYEYTIAFDQEKSIPLLKKYLSAYSKSMDIPESDLELSDKELDDLKEYLANDIKFWISKKEVNFVSVEQTVKQSVVINDPYFINVSTTVIINTHDYDSEDNRVTTPEDIHDITDFMESQEIESSNAHIKTSLSNIRPLAEISYDKKGSYGFVCTDPDVSMYISDIRLENAGPVVCNAGPSSYAAWAKMLDGNWWCVDSKGFSVQLEEEPSQNSLSCKK